jgi:hypothetical protein
MKFLLHARGYGYFVELPINNVKQKAQIARLRYASKIYQPANVQAQNILTQRTRKEAEARFFT